MGLVLDPITVYLSFISLFAAYSALKDKNGALVTLQVWRRVLAATSSVNPSLWLRVWGCFFWGVFGFSSSHWTQSACRRPWLVSLSQLQQLRPSHHIPDCAFIQLIAPTLPPHTVWMTRPVRVVCHEVLVVFVVLQSPNLKLGQKFSTKFSSWFEAFLVKFCVNLVKSLNLGFR